MERSSRGRGGSALLTTLVAGALLIDYCRRRRPAAAASPRTGSNTNVALAPPPAVPQSTGSGFDLAVSRRRSRSEASDRPRCDPSPRAGRRRAIYVVDGGDTPCRTCPPRSRGIEGDTRSTCTLSGRRPTEVPSTGTSARRPPSAIAAATAFFASLVDDHAHSTVRRHAAARAGNTVFTVRSRRPQFSVALAH